MAKTTTCYEVELHIYETLPEWADKTLAAALQKTHAKLFENGLDKKTLRTPYDVCGYLNRLLRRPMAKEFEPAGYSLRFVTKSTGNPTEVWLFSVPTNQHPVSKLLIGDPPVAEFSLGKLLNYGTDKEPCYAGFSAATNLVATTAVGNLTPYLHDGYVQATKQTMSRMRGVFSYLGNFSSEEQAQLQESFQHLFDTFRVKANMVTALQHMENGCGSTIDKIMDQYWRDQLRSAMLNIEAESF
jgi:hypothetical protein